jgi:CheY-like chemotaxis protein
MMMLTVLLRPRTLLTNPFAAHRQMLALYHPTSIVLVDDNADFLRSIRLVLESMFQCHAFSSAELALDFVRAQSLSLRDQSSHRQAPPEGAMEYIRDPDARALHASAARLPSTFSDAGRFSRTSVIVADETMPGMSGIEMLEAMRDAPFRKLLLSGTANEELADRALRDGVIDAFCPKNDTCLHDTLTDQLVTLQQEFFRGLTRPIEPALTVADTRFLQDPAVLEMFREFVARHSIIEYCACLHPPGILGLDIEGNAAMLVVVNDDYLQASFEIAHAEHAPTELLRLLVRGDTLAVFPTASGFYANGLATDWRDCLWEARKVGDNGWYGAMIDEPEVTRAICGSVTSYGTYRRRRLS